MTDHIENRRAVLERLRRELIGPDPRGASLPLADGIELPDPGEERRERGGEDKGFVPQAFRPWTDASTGEEILSQDRPCKRYGVGILYPVRTSASDPGESAEDDAAPDVPDEASPLLTEEGDHGLQEIRGRGARGSEPEDAVDLHPGLSGANAYLPSAMGLSFLANPPASGKLRLAFSGGRYLPVRVRMGERSRKWWVRRPVEGSAEIDSASLNGLNGPTVIPVAGTFRGTEEGDGAQAIDLRFHVVARPHAEGVLVTVSAINRSEHDPGDTPDGLCIFQSALDASVIDAVSREPVPAILPYPRPPGEQLDDEEQEIELLHRKTLTYAVGHGCAADWSEGENGRAMDVQTSALPVFEAPSITPDIPVDARFRISADGTNLQVRMAALAGLLQDDDGLPALKSIVSAYELWLVDRESDAATLQIRHRDAAARHLTACRTALERMRAGLEMLEERGPQADLVRTAFRLANHAMGLQRIRTASRATRRFEWSREEERWVLPEPHPPEPETSDLRVPTWRPFQIAFLLMTLPSTALTSDPFRETVDLIWFPTGGGKTEAYLGLAAFSIFLRRLRALRHNAEDAGVQVLMRYTLRLLTAQQFQRAAALLCAMESLRRRRPEGVNLGEREFSLGMWTGATPNYRDEARAAFRAICREDPPRDNIVVLERCPWCRAQMGPVRRPEGRAGQRVDIQGYEQRARSGTGATTVVAACGDPKCEFRSGLPLHFVDEDMYDARIDPPSMIIGTVDKFAMLAWRPNARRLFGRNDAGLQATSPPGLILQDELHLISGPLGTMVGLYETTIEDLCTDRRDGDCVLPKIVASTATIRSYRDQVRRLFGRGDARLFPPAGLDADDSFFSRHAADKDGRPLPGKIFVGVHAPGLGSVQTTQVRVFSCLLQAPMKLPDGQEARDPWWTLVAFYNSLRELGGGLTLFHSDVPDYLWGVIRQREGLAPGELRKLHRIEELTGRLEDHEVVNVMSKLEQETTGSEPPVDVCLASNIIEVGVDIDRLSLLAVVGQPKSTAQYIQVTGRIGRKWAEKPGLVVTIYGPSKPRDRSHYERFRTYHQQLYAQVEPTSVTPFSTPALERGLHGALAAYIRQLGPLGSVDRPDIASTQLRQLLSAFTSLARARLDRVQHGERQDLDRVLDRRSTQWESWLPRRWEGEVTRDVRDVPLLRWPGRFATREVRGRSWLTPTSMRTVDAECRVSITGYYAEVDGAGADDGGARDE